MENLNKNGNKKKEKHKNVMRLTKPRIPPLEFNEMDDKMQKILKPYKRMGRGKPYNIYATLARHPRLFKHWTIFASYLLGKSLVPSRERELMILRVGWLCHSEYEWSQHISIGKKCGLKEEDFKRIIEGPESPGWDPFEATLIQAVDELHENFFISDPTWTTLSKRYDEKQLMDLLFTVGQYHLVSMFLNTLGIQIDEGFTGFPE